MNIKKALLFAGAILITTSIYYRELIQYGWWQGTGQLSILLNAQPIDDLLADPDISDSLKSKLILLNHIKDFGGSIGLKVNDSYTTIYNQKGKPVLWNVSACEPYAFNSYQWKFPILGSFGYKGFFDLEKAKNLAAKLKNQGYDVRIRTVGAWSTLGWFNDPLLSNQLFKSEGALAETILHELTHATIFFPDSLDYNENLATFIGREATERFLIQHFGSHNSAVTTYLNEEADAHKFRTHFLNGKKKLDSLYESMKGIQDTSYRFQLKTDLIQQIVAELDTVSFTNEKYHDIFSPDQLPNNAFFMGYNRYYSKQDSFKIELKAFDNDLSAWISHLSVLQD